MSSNRDVNRAVRSWLEEGVTVLPDRVLDAVLDQVPTIPQRRAGWLARRLQVMNTNRFRFGIAAAAIVAAAFLGLRFLPSSNVGGPAESTPTPEGSSFTSDRYQYSLLLPDDSWMIVERRGEWAPGTTFDQDSPGLDFADKIGESEPYILINSQVVPEGTDQDQWFADFDRANETAFPHCALEQSESGTVDREPARINTYLCDDSYRGVEAVTFHGGRVYVVRVFDPEGDPSFEPRPVLDEWLDGFRFVD